MANDSPAQIPAPTRAAVAEIRTLFWPLSLVMTVVVALTAWTMVESHDQYREREAARIEAMAALRAGQVATWLRDHLGRVGFAGRSPMGELFLRWRDGRETVAHERLLDRLSSFHKASGGHSVRVLDDQGQVVAGTTQAENETPSPLRDAARRAIASNEPQFTNLYGYEGKPPAPRIDVVAPLTLTGQPARAVLVVTLDPRDFLFPTLREWPLPSRSAASVLVRREGDFLVEPHSRTRLPLSTPDLLAARVLRGDVPPGQAVDALDFRGQPVLGVVRPIAGTDWFLMARIDRAEAYADAWRNALWIAAAGVLALLAIGVGAYWFREREALQFARIEGAHREEKLRALQLLDAIAQGSTDGIFAKDRTGRYLLCNEAACRALGKTREEIVGNTDLALFSPAEAARLAASDAQVIAQGRATTYEVAFTTARGLSTFLTTKGPLRNIAGEVTGVFGISRDITERTRAAAELDRYRHHLEELVKERTASLERTVSDLEAFSASVSHDLRGPLQTVSGFATLLERSEASALSEGGRRKLARIIAGAATMDRMIQDILACSRAERVEMNFRPVDLNDLVGELLHELAPACPNSHVSTGPLPVVQADPTLMGQVFNNLIGNALKFSARQSSPRVEIGTQEGPDGTEIFVRDNGVGFDAAQLDKLFAPFQRLHSAEDFAGTGVGLSIVKRLIERHGGRIRAESVPGERTTFAFTLGADRAGASIG
ncbi:sensor histidine kinase [Polaromonas sp.]|uniref:sensor histidine kinase n=1 Tax=Polaromonas sp. TaxID=1869339 RepID=UPI002FC9BF16